jgi:ribosome-binding protein aMBF1 (putative translation factor)
MNDAKRKRLVAAGFVYGDAEDFLDLTKEERQMVELRLAVSRAVRARRKKAKLTQTDLAIRLNTSQPRIAKIESASSGVSLDQMFHGLFALGGTLKDVAYKC